MFDVKGLSVYQYYSRDDLNIECINDTLRRYFRYTAHVPAGLLLRYGAVRLYRVVLITTISHDVRELQRSLQFGSVDNHHPVV